MSYEKFNDAMCRLKQAEEEFHKKLQEAFKPFIDEINRTNAQIDAKVETLQEKEERQVDLQEQINEAYNKGIQDSYNAICCLLARCEKVPPMPISEMRRLFGTVYFDKIIIDNLPEEIIDKVNQWKAEQNKEEQELHVGDEIEYARSKSRFEKRIIIGIEDGMDDDEKIIWSIDLELSGPRFWFFSTDKDVEYRKTGKHYDAIPFPKRIK